MENSYKKKPFKQIQYELRDHKLSCTGVMINMKILSVVTSPYIYQNVLNEGGFQSRHAIH